MAKNNKTCKTCSKLYTYCPTCSQDKDKPAYMNMFCSENCKNIFMAASDYAAGEIDKAKAKQIIQSANLTDQVKFKDSIKKFLKEISSDNSAMPEKKDEVKKSEEVKNITDNKNDVKLVSDNKVLNTVNTVKNNKPFDAKNK